jgi:hypothetical protein
MGHRSTLCISRGSALRKLRDACWNSLSDEELGDVLLALLHDTSYNFSVGWACAPEPDERVFRGLRYGEREDP